MKKEICVIYSQSDQYAHKRRYYDFFMFNTVY